VPKRSVLNVFLLLLGVFILVAGAFGRDRLRGDDTVPCAGERTSNRGVPRHSRERPNFDPDCTIEAISESAPPADSEAPPLSTRVANLPSVPQAYGFRLTAAPILQMPFWVDSNSPVAWAGDKMLTFNSAFEETNRAVGSGLYATENVSPVVLPRPERPGNVWIEAVWRDPLTAVLYGWYHFEPGDLICEEGLTAPIIGAALSFDNGATWEDRGFVLESAHSIDCDYGNGYFVGGNGDFSVVASPAGDYFYFVYSQYGGDREDQGIAVARSRFFDRGQPGTVFKYHRGRWEEPGIGGLETPIFGVDRSWAGVDVDALWGPAVHWNSYLDAYVVLMNRAVGEFWAQDGVYITFTRDFMSWTFPEKLLDTPDWYPQIIGIGPGETDSFASRTTRLFVGGYSEALLQFDLLPKPEPSLPAPGNGPPPGQSEAPLGQAEP
jgi:hypothetical protein